MVFEPETIARRRKRKPVTPIEPPKEELPEFEPEPIARMRMGRPSIPPEEELELPELLQRVYPEWDFETEEGAVALDIMLQMAVEDPASFIQDIQAKGQSSETIALLRAFDATPEEIEQVFATEVIAPPSLAVPNWLTFDFWKEALFRPYAGEDLAGKAYFSFIAGIGDVISTSGGTSRWLGYEEAGGTLSTIGSTIQRVAPPPTTGEFEMADMLDPEWYATKVTRTIPFALTLLPLAVGGYYAGSALATELGLSTLWAWIIGGFTGAALSRPLESALEAGAQYDDAIARGKTETEAKAEADEVFRENMKLAGMDAFQIAIALAPTPKWVPTSLVRAGLVRTTRIAGKMVIIGLTEGGEEVYQDMVQRHARGEEWQLDPVSKEVFAIGMVMGLGMGLGGDVVTGLADNVKKKMTPDIKGDFDTAVESFEAQGFRTDQSELKALDTISQTPEGEKIVTETLKELQETPAVAEIPEEVLGAEKAEELFREGKLTKATEEEVDAVLLTTLEPEVYEEYHRLLDLRETGKASQEQITAWFDKEAKTLFKQGWVYNTEENAWYKPIAKPPVVKEPEIPEVIQIPEAPEGETISSKVVASAQELTREEFIAQNADLVVKEKGRWGTYHYALKTRKHDYQLVGQIFGDSAEGALGLLYDRLQQVEVPVAAKPPIAKKVEPEAIEVIGEGGIPVPPEEPIAKGVVTNSEILRNVGWKEEARPARKVFERLGLFRVFKGIQKAEVLVGEAKIATQKKVSELFKPIAKERRYLVFREVNEVGSQVGLTFDEKRAVTWTKNFYDEWADRKNLPAEKRIKNYITHLFEAEMVAELKETGKISPELAMLLSDRVAKTITDPFLKERLGTVGFQEDPMVSILAYDAVANRVLHYEPFLQKIASIANDPKQRGDVRDYMKNYSRRMTGEPSKHDLKINADLQEIASKLEKVPGGKALARLLSNGNPSGWLAYQLTGGLYTMWLGFKATSAIRNLSQHTLIIGETGPVHFANALKLRFTKEGKAALGKSLVLRSRKAAFMPGIDDSFAAQWTDKFRETALYMFRGADKQNVSDATLAGYSEAKEILTKDQNKVPPDERLPQEELDELILWRGEEVAGDTQYLYTKMNSMAFSQSAPGRVLSVLTTWMENWIELMSKWIARRPSQVYLEYERRTGRKVAGANWASSYKAILMYMVIVGLGFAIKEETRLKAWEYTGITSIRYLADVLGGDFPGLQYIGAAANIAAGIATDDERRLNEGLRELNPAKMVGIIRQLNAVMAGDKDWLTLLFYLEGRDWKTKQLKEDWKKDYADYPLFRDKDGEYDPELYREYIRTHREQAGWSGNKIRSQWRDDNPKLEAKMFIVNQFSTLSTDEARAEVLRLIEKHDLDVEMIDGYEKVFGVDTAVELDKFQNRVGNLEKLEVGVEAEYFTMNNFASEVNTFVRNQGRTKVEQDGNQLAVEYLRAKDLFVQYDSLEEADARKQYRLQFPDVEASLYLWGRISAFLNPNSAVELLRLMKKYDIPPEGIKAFVDDPAKYDALQAPLFQLQLEWNEMLVAYELAEQEERELMLEQNPKFRDARRQIEAINKGIPENLVMPYVEYYAMDIKGWEQERYLKENEEFYKEVWLGILENEEKDFEKIPSIEFEKASKEYEALEAFTANEAIVHIKRARQSHIPVEGVSIDAWNQKWIDNYDFILGVIEDYKVGETSSAEISKAIAILREDIQLDEPVGGWDAWIAKEIEAGRISQEAIDSGRVTFIHREMVMGYRSVISLLSGETREQYLINHSAFRKEKREREAVEKEIPEKLHSEYVEYYEFPDAGYANERYLMEHEEFYRYMVDSGEWNEKDFSKVPTEKFEESLGGYELLDKGYDRYEYRGNNPWFDEEGVRIGRWDAFDPEEFIPRNIKTLLEEYDDLPTTGKDRLIYRHNHPELEKWFVEEQSYVPVGDRWKVKEEPEPKPKPTPKPKKVTPKEGETWEEALEEMEEKLKKLRG